MAYKLKCKDCGHTYIAAQRYYNCERSTCRSSRQEFIEDVAEAAVDAATAYFAVDLAMDVIGGVGDMIGSIFD